VDGREAGERRPGGVRALLRDRRASGRGDDAVLEGSVEPGEVLVSIRDLKKHFDVGGFTGDPVRAVDGVSLDVRRGETLGLVGESGCGKTTLGRTLVGLESATEGSVEFRGTDITTLSGTALREWQRDVGMVFQDPEGSLNDRMTVGEIVREPLDVHDWRTPAERRRRVFEFLERVGLHEEHYYRYPHQFSGGQRQRVGIARALVLEPSFAVLDEPTSALDASVQARIINLLEDLQEELGLTYLFITHDLSVVRHIADRIAVIYLGNVVESGPTEAVFDTPAHPYTAALLSAIPGSAGVSGERITLRGTPPSPRDPPPGCPFATRCPAKVRPDEHDGLDEAAWAAIDEFRAVLRARARADRSALDRVKRAVGVGEAEDVDEIVEELFADVTLGESARGPVDEAAASAAGGDDRAAAARVLEAFGSVCDESFPAAHDIGGDHLSRCVRHEASYRGSARTIDDRFGTAFVDGSPGEAAPAPDAGSDSGPG